MVKMRVSTRASAGRSSSETAGRATVETWEALRDERTRGVGVGRRQVGEGDERGREAVVRDEAPSELGHRDEVAGAGAGDQHDVRPRLTRRYEL